MVTTPPHKTLPNWNIGDVLNHVKEVLWSAWLLALLIVIYDNTAGFKVCHQVKIWITYNTEGYWFKMDEICDRGFTYDVYLCNQPPPKNISTLDYHHCTLNFLFCLIL